MDINIIKRNWDAELKTLGNMLKPCFNRAEAFNNSIDYIKGLLSNVERKNGWQLAEQIGNDNPYKVQHLLNRSKWDEDKSITILKDYLKNNIEDDDSILIFDETGFIKQGTKSAGVQRQYTGTSGKKDNCQVGVFAIYSNNSAYSFLDKRLYIPKTWIEDEKRREEAHIPESLNFKTKPQLATEMFNNLNNDIAFKWVCADSIYGSDGQFRIDLENYRKSYIVGVRSNTYVWHDIKSYRVDELTKIYFNNEWHRLSCGKGSKGERFFDWLIIPINHPYSDYERFLLVRRNINDSDDLSYYIVFCKSETELSEMVRVAGSRWRIEDCFKHAKGDVGLDEYEVRSYIGWNRHITLSLLAHAVLSVLTYKLNIEKDILKKIVL
jgi:SRSO17 transposase